MVQVYLLVVRVFKSEDVQDEHYGLVVWAVYVHHPSFPPVVGLVYCRP